MSTNGKVFTLILEDPMEKHRCVVIAPEKLKGIRSLDFWMCLFCKDSTLFPDADVQINQESIRLFAEKQHYCSPFSVASNNQSSRRFEYKGKFIEFTPGADGLPNIRDWDILIFCISWIAQASIDGRDSDFSPVYQFSVEDFYTFSCRPRGGNREAQLLQGLEKLASCRLTTDITPLGMPPRSFNLIPKYNLGRDEQGRLQTVIMLIPYWLNVFAYGNYGYSLPFEYFSLAPARRMIFLFIRQHMSTTGLTVSFEKLRQVAGVTSPMNKFMPVIADLVNNPLPHLKASLNQEDQTAIFTPID